MFVSACKVRPLLNRKNVIGHRAGPRSPAGAPCGVIRLNIRVLLLTYCFLSRARATNWPSLKGLGHSTIQFVCRLLRVSHGGKRGHGVQVINVEI